MEVGLRSSLPYNPKTAMDFNAFGSVKQYIIFPKVFLPLLEFIDFLFISKGNLFCL